MHEKVADYIRENDRLFEFTGARLLEVSPGRCVLSMEVSERHMNAAGICQGGVVFTFADLAFAIASNSHGVMALSVNASISYLRPALLGDTLVAEAQEVERTRRLAHYSITVRKDPSGEKVALFTGVVYITGKPYEF